MTQGFKILIVFFVSTLCNAQTVIPDMTEVSGNWTLIGSPYMVQGKIIIPKGKTLVISPGVIVEFSSSTDTTLLNTSTFGSLWVKGKILAEGITFKAMGNGYWKGIKFDENCDKTGSIKNSLIQDAFYQIDLGW